MGVIFLALVAGGYATPETGCRCGWSSLRRAPSRSGTYSGGWRIMRTLGRRIIHLDPARGFSAESVGATVLYTTAFVWHAPVSTTHIITSAIMGAGATKRLLRRALGRGALDPGRLGPDLPGRRQWWRPWSTSSWGTSSGCPSARSAQLSGIRSFQPAWIRSGSLIWSFAATICATVVLPKSRALRTMPVRVSPFSTR